MASKGQTATQVPQKSHLSLMTPIMLSPEKQLAGLPVKQLTGNQLTGEPANALDYFAARLG
jgi:hypothetical protein